MFFTDQCTLKCGFVFNTKVSRAFLDGSSQKVIVEERIYGPSGITLDYVNKRLYWCDYKANQIATVDYDGGDRYV